MSFFKKLFECICSRPSSQDLSKYQLQCKRCERLFNIGLDASIMSMDEALQVGGGKGWAVFANSEVSRQPDMVVSFKDCPPSDLQHSQEIATTSRMKIESSLIRGDRRKWYCQNCGNDALPYKYPKHFV